MPIKELKNTAAFSQLVNNSPDPNIVTRNGNGASAVMTIKEPDAPSRGIALSPL